MFSNDFIVSIYVNNNCISESKNGTVAVPFGVEYTIRLRNKHNRRAVAKVFIDEQNVTENGIIVNATSYVDLECDTKHRLKFKFMSTKSKEAKESGKVDNHDDSNGVIRVEWRLEKEYKYVPSPLPVKYSPWEVPYKRWEFPYRNKSIIDTVIPCSVSPKKFSLSEGCTVEGGQSNQNFVPTSIDLENTVTIIRLVLKGHTEKSFQQSRRLHCERCGASAKRVDAKFCWNCGQKL